MRRQEEMQVVGLSHTRVARPAIQWRMFSAATVRPIAALDLTYVAGILPNTAVWEEGEEPLPPKQSSGRGRPAKVMRRDAEHQPISVKDLALDLPERLAQSHVARRCSSACSPHGLRARARAHRASRYKLTESRPEGPRAKRRRELRVRPEGTVI